ncbi:phage holin [Tessaracoccus sp.]
MSDNTRRALYALVPTALTLLAFYGLVTGPQSVAIGQDALLVIGVLYAALNAHGNRLLDPTTRRAIYLLIGAIPTTLLAYGFHASAITMWGNVVLGLLFSVLSILNVVPVGAEPLVVHEDGTVTGGDPAAPPVGPVV